MKYFLAFLLTILACNSLPAAASETSKSIEDKLMNLLSDKDADVGVSIIYDGCDTVSINSNRSYPMASVYKFPQALYVINYLSRHNISLSDTCRVLPSDMHLNTWSPMRDRFGAEGTVLTLAELLSYSLQQSDNNACDVLFRISGGPSKVDEMLKDMGFADINVKSTEDEMHRDPALPRLNSSTPEAMACLMDNFNHRLRTKSEYHRFIAETLEKCETGRNRLVHPLSKMVDWTIGHKTGTGDVDSEGRITAINDAGYVNLPDGRRYAIAVFVTDSKLGMEGTEKLVAEISAIAMQYYDL